MAVRIKRKWVSITTFLLLSFIVIITFTNHFFFTNNHEHVFLKSKVTIIDHSKLTVTPILESNQITFYFQLESYENTDFLNLNMKEFCIITYQEKLITPLNWTILKESNYKLEATLSTPLYEEELLYPIRIEFFFDAPLKLIWEKN